MFTFIGESTRNRLYPEKEALSSGSLWIFIWYSRNTLYDESKAVGAAFALRGINFFFKQKKCCH